MKSDKKIAIRVTAILAISVLALVPVSAQPAPPGDVIVSAWSETPVNNRWYGNDTGRVG